MCNNIYISDRIYYIEIYKFYHFSEDVLEIWQELDFTMLSKKKGEDFDAVKALDTFPAMELPSLNQYLLHSAHLDEDLHILPGEKPESRLQVIVRGL